MTTYKEIAELNSKVIANQESAALFASSIRDAIEAMQAKLLKMQSFMLEEKNARCTDTGDIREHIKRGVIGKVQDLEGRLDRLEDRLGY